MFLIQPKKPRCLTLDNQKVFSFYFLRIFNYYLFWTSDFRGSVQPLKVWFVCKSVCHVSVCLFVCLLNVYLAVVYWFWTRWPIPRIRRNTCKHYCHFINTKSLSVCLCPINLKMSIFKFEKSMNVTDKLRKKKQIFSFLVVKMAPFKSIFLLYTEAAHKMLKISVQTDKSWLRIKRINFS